MKFWKRHKDEDVLLNAEWERREALRMQIERALERYDMAYGAGERLERMARELVRIPFDDCLVDYHALVDDWTVWLWLFRNMEMIFHVDVNGDFSIGIFKDKECLVNEEYTSAELEEVVSTMIRAMTYVDRYKREKSRKKGIWHGFCSWISKKFGKHGDNFGQDVPQGVL